MFNPVSRHHTGFVERAQGEDQLDFRNAVYDKFSIGADTGQMEIGCETRNAQALVTPFRRLHHVDMSFRLDFRPAPSTSPVDGTLSQPGGA